MIDYSKYSDEKLLALLTEQSPERDYAFDVIFNRYSQKLRAYCLYKAENNQF